MHCTYRFVEAGVVEIFGIADLLSIPGSPIVVANSVAYPTGLDVVKPFLDTCK